MLRCCCLFWGRLIQRGYPWILQDGLSRSHGPQIHPRRHPPLGCVVCVVPAPDPLPFLPLIPSWHRFPTSPDVWTCSAPASPHWAPAGASHARSRLQGWFFLLLLCLFLPLSLPQQQQQQQAGVSVQVSSQGILGLLQSDVKCIQCREDAADGISAAPRGQAGSVSWRFQARDCPFSLWKGQ